MIDLRYVAAIFLLCLLVDPVPSHAGQNKKDEERKNASQIAAGAWALLGFTGYGRFGGNSSTTMTCQGTPPYSTITCDFARVEIRLKTDDATLEKERLEFKAGLEAAPEAELLKGYKDLLKPNPENDRREKALLSAGGSHKLSPEQAQNIKRIAHFRETLGPCSDKPCVIQKMLQFNDLDRHACTVTTTMFRWEFRKAGPNKFISTQGPSGGCAVVRFVALETDPDSGDLWRLTETVVSRETAPICEGIEVNKPVIYSWDAPSRFDLNCQTFELNKADLEALRLGY